MVKDTASKGLTATFQKQLPCFTLDLCLECTPGETLVVIGPSGSGKTTALRCQSVRVIASLATCWGCGTSRWFFLLDFLVTLPLVFPPASSSCGWCFLHCAPALPRCWYSCWGPSL